MSAFKTLPTLQHNPNLTWSRKTVAEILDEIAIAPNRNAKLHVLKKHSDCPTLRHVLRGAFDASILWLLPEGVPPFRNFTAKTGEAPSNLHRNSKNFYLYVEATQHLCGSNYTQKQRELNFIQLLESLPTRDAYVMCDVKDQCLDVDGLTPDLINEAFPGLLVKPITFRAKPDPVPMATSAVTEAPVESVEKVAEEQVSIPIVAMESNEDTDSTTNPKPLEEAVVPKKTRSRKGVPKRRNRKTTT